MAHPARSALIIPALAYLGACGLFGDDDPDAPVAKGDPVVLTGACHEIPSLTPRWSPFDPDVGVGFGTHFTGLYTTHDRGRTWARIPYDWSSSFPDASSGFSPSAVVFLDADHWIVTGAITRGNNATLDIASRVIATADAGLTFTPLYEGSDDTRFVAYPQEPGLQPFGVPADAVFRQDEQRVAVLSRGLLLGSADNGATWPARVVFYPTWVAGAGVPGLSPGAEVLWKRLDPNGVGLVTLSGLGVALTRDGGASFEQVSREGASRAYLDPLGRVVTVERRATSLFFHVYGLVDGRWQEVASNLHDFEAGLNAKEVLWFSPDGSFVAQVFRHGQELGFELAFYAVDGDRLVHHDVVVDVGPGVGLGSVEAVDVLADTTRLIAMGAGRRLACELGDGIAPVALPPAGLPDDLAPGEMALYARRTALSGALDRFAIDGEGLAYVAAARALWNAPVGAGHLFTSAVAGPADWKPSGPGAELAEVGGVAIAPSGEVVLAVNYLIGNGVHRPHVLFLDPTSGQVLRWRAFEAFGSVPQNDIRVLDSIGGLVFASTSRGTADIDAGEDVGPERTYAGLPGLGRARPDGVYYYLQDRTPRAEGHLIGRGHVYSGRLPSDEASCEDCAAFPGMVQAFDADDAGHLYVLDRREAAVYRRAFDDHGGDWELLASGFHNPADVHVVDIGGPLVLVLDGDIFAFRPDPERPAVRGLQMRAGPGERPAPTPPAGAPADGACDPASAAPCIDPPRYTNPQLAELQGIVLLDPINDGQFCLRGQGFGTDQGVVRLGATSAARITHWLDLQVCGHADLDGLTDGLMVLETAAGLHSNVLPYLAPARNVRFQHRADRPLQTGDVVTVVGDNLGLRGHFVLGGLSLGVSTEGLEVLLDATSNGSITFRKLPDTQHWMTQVAVFPSQLVGAVAGPNEAGGVSGHVGSGVAWFLDDAPLDGGLAPGWYDDVPLGEHVLTARFAGRELSVAVPRVPYDTDAVGTLHPDGIGLPRHHQGVAALAGQAYALRRSSTWRRPGGPTSPLVPGVPEVDAVASVPRAGDGPFIPGQAFERVGGLAPVDRNYDASEDMPRVASIDGALFLATRAREVTIEPDLQGNPTVTRSQPVIPMTVDVTDARLAEGDPMRTVNAVRVASIVVPNQASDGVMAGIGGGAGRVWVALAAAGETWLVGGAAATPEAWAPLGVLAGEWDAHPVGDGVLFLQAGDGDDPVALRRGHFDANETLAVGEPLPTAVDGDAITRIMAWRAEDDGTMLFALRLASGAERVAVLGPGDSAFTALATIPADLPGVGATYDAGGLRARYGVADVIRWQGQLVVALAGGRDEARRGLWLARLTGETAALSRELASVEVDMLRCLGPYPRQPGSCGTTGQIETNTRGCTYLACPQLTRLWLPVDGGAVEEARLAADDDGLQVTYAVSFPAGWNGEPLDFGRIRTAVFTGGLVFE